MNSTTSQPNPYAAPKEVLLHHQPIYAWPLSPDRVLGWDVVIDDAQLEKCIEGGKLFIGIHQIFFLLSLIATLTLSAILIIATIVNSVGLWVFLVCSFGSVIYNFSRMSAGWHARYLFRTRGWLWGPVRIELHSQGVRWRAEHVEFDWIWDSFTLIERGSSCVWMVTVYPFACCVPIHRDWMSESEWGDLLLILETHPASKLLNDRWVGQKIPKEITFDALAAPDWNSQPTGSVPFRTEPHAFYWSDWTTVFLRGNEPTFSILVSVSILMVPYLTWYFGLRVPNVFSFYELFPFILILQVLVPWLLKLRPFGLGITNQSQPLLRSQSGYVGRELISFASPACTVTIKPSEQIRIIEHTKCLLVRLLGARDSTLVVPWDQFGESDAIEVRSVILGHWTKAQ